MSFDLYVWHQAEAISAADALGKVRRWDEGESDVFARHPQVSACFQALLMRFPALEDLSEDDIDSAGVWSWTPEASDQVLALSCVWSRCDEVANAVRELAEQHGLVCYDPQDDVVRPNAPGYTPMFTLTLYNGLVVRDPDARRLAWTASQIGRGNFYAILERADGWYVQVGYGSYGNAAPGRYAMEYREATAHSHHRAETSDVTEVARFLQEFATGTDVWKRRHRWTQITV